MTKLLNTSFLDPIAGFIRLIERARNYLEIDIPKGLIIDRDEILKYYEEDVTLVYQAGKGEHLKGILKDSGLFNYLSAKYYEKGIIFKR